MRKLHNTPGGRFAADQEKIMLKILAREREEKDPRFTEVAQLDICLPDYFSGYHFPVLSIPTFRYMTLHDVADGITSEINGSFDYLVNEGQKDRTYTKDEIKLFEEFAKKLKEGPADPITGLSFCDCEEEDPDCECETAYIYFGLCKPVTKYGLTFLNE